MRPGRCFGLGVGPGDPELITVKAQRILAACPVFAHFAKAGRRGNARGAVEPHLNGQRELRLEYPITTEAPPPGVSYESLLVDCYDRSAKQIAEVLDQGTDVAVLCEGDPLFYGSYMYLHHRLESAGYEVEVVPGVPAMLAGAAALGAPLAAGEEMLCVLSGVLPVDELERRLRAADVAVVMKLGRNLARVREAVERAGLLDRARYVERVSMSAERMMPLRDVDPDTSPYFSMVVIPSATACER